MATREELTEAVTTFITNDLAWDGVTVDLLGDPLPTLPELLDSQDLLELAGFLEVEFGIEIADEEITRDNFATVPDLVCFVEQKRVTGKM